MRCTLDQTREANCTCRSIVCIRCALRLDRGNVTSSKNERFFFPLETRDFAGRSGSCQGFVDRLSIEFPARKRARYATHGCRAPTEVDCADPEFSRRFQSSRDAVAPVDDATSRGVATRIGRPSLTCIIPQEASPNTIDTFIVDVKHRWTSDSSCFIEKLLI